MDIQNVNVVSAELLQRRLYRDMERFHVVADVARLLLDIGCTELPVARILNSNVSQRVWRMRGRY